MNKFPRSAYVHIPFCHRRCFYCDFAVIPLGNNVETLKGYGSKTVQEYLQFLYKEILSIKHKSPLSTIYVGGGTPSILDPTQIKELIDLFRENYGIDYGAEITMEVDPASFTQDDLFGFINAGINRFSLGVQSFNNQILQKSGRLLKYLIIKSLDSETKSIYPSIYKSMKIILIKTCWINLHSNFSAIVNSIIFFKKIN